MIIKSMARKEATFTQLYDYITRDRDHDNRFIYTQNFILNDREEVLNEFERNSDLLSKRSNGNYLYHEIISITRSQNISEEKQKEILQNIVSQYAKSRAKDCLIFGGLHDEKDNNLHFHLMISANKLDDSKRYSLKKAQFHKIKAQTEEYVLERFPEIEQEKLITKKQTNKFTSNREEAMKYRTRQPSQKDIFKEKLQSIFEDSIDKQSFFDNLKNASIEIYTRGKTIGFIDLETGKKHRLKTLGLVDEFEAINQTLSDQHVKNEAKPVDKPGQSSNRVNPAKSEEVKAKSQSSESPNQAFNKDETIEQRTTNLSQKDDFRKRLKAIFKKSVDNQSLSNNLNTEQIEFYTQGSVIWFKDLETGERHSLKNFGLYAQFEAINETLESEQKPVSKRDEIIAERLGKIRKRREVDQQGKTDSLTGANQIFTK